MPIDITVFDEPGLRDELTLIGRKCLQGAVDGLPKLIELQDECDEMTWSNLVILPTGQKIKMAVTISLIADE